MKALISLWGMTVLAVLSWVHTFGLMRQKKNKKTKAEARTSMFGSILVSVIAILSWIL